MKIETVGTDEAANVYVNDEYVGIVERAPWVTERNGKPVETLLWFAIPEGSAGLGRQEDRIGRNIGSGKTRREAAEVLAGRYA